MAKNYEVVTTNEFNESFKYYGYEEFVRKALHRCSNKKEYGLTGDITIHDAEPSKRVYLRNENGTEFALRYWIREANEKFWECEYTLWAYLFNEETKDEESIPLDNGYMKINYPKINEEGVGGIFDSEKRSKF